MEKNAPVRQETVGPGKPAPLGATWDGLGVNFALYSEHAEEVELVLFGAPGYRSESKSVRLLERTGPIWHGYFQRTRSPVSDRLARAVRTRDQP